MEYTEENDGKSHHWLVSSEHNYRWFYIVSLQRWARAFRDNDYHCAVDTNNGVEAQNRLFKYTFLPRNKQKATLSSVITILVNDYLPSCKQKYLFQNYRQLSQYRAKTLFLRICTIGLVQ